MYLKKGQAQSNVINKVSQNMALGTEEGTLNATKSALCNSFENFFGSPNVAFYPINAISFC